MRIPWDEYFMLIAKLVSTWLTAATAGPSTPRPTPSSRRPKWVFPLKGAVLFETKYQPKGGMNAWLYG